MALNHPGTSSCGLEKIVGYSTPPGGEQPQVDRQIHHLSVAITLGKMEIRDREPSVRFEGLGNLGVLPSDNLGR